MGEQPLATGAGVSWGKVAAMALLIVAVIYAVQHPQSFFYYLVKMIILPIP
jgi:hypothetical protein